MAMQAQHYSLSALAAELPPAARTWAKYLEDVKPSKIVGRTKYYRMADAVRAVPPHLLEMFPVSDDGEQLDLNQQSARLKKAQADKTELEVQVLKGSLIHGDIVDRVWGDQLAASRSKLVGLPSTAAPRVVGLDINETEHELRDLVHQALDELRAYEPADYASGSSKQAADEDGKELGTAAKPKRKRVGGRKKGSVKRGKRGTGKMAD